MDGPLDKTAKRPRADALRNRERVLEAAKLVFNAGGPEASLEAVARRAEVGIGTLYRHFPTREALFEAVYRREVQQLVELVDQLSAELPPVEALRRWLRANVELVATKKGMATALAVAARAPPALMAFSVENLTRAMDTLLSRSIAAGQIRSDITAEDMLRAMIGLCYTHSDPGWQTNVFRLVDVLVDGLLLRPDSAA